MSREQKRDLSASVLAKLLLHSKRTGEDYQRLLIAFICERFLFRLGVSAERDRFVLKGAMLFRIWNDQPYRATQDLDLLRNGDGSAAALRRDLEAVCATDVEPDGLLFDSPTIRLEPIRAEDEYVGTRVMMNVRCGKARVPLQIDIGLGDSAWPPPRTERYHTLLDFAAPEILVYAKESVVAEKLEAIVVLGDRNSRIKDFFDLAFLARRHCLRPCHARRVRAQDVRSP